MRGGKRYGCGSCLAALSLNLAQRRFGTLQFTSFAKIECRQAMPTD